jgi:hypothetical protein
MKHLRLLIFGAIGLVCWITGFTITTFIVLVVWMSEVICIIYYYHKEGDKNAEKNNQKR